MSTAPGSRTTEAGRVRREERLLMEFTGMLSAAVSREVLGSLGPEGRQLAARISRREIDPYTGSEELVRRFRERLAQLFIKHYRR